MDSAAGSQQGDTAFAHSTTGTRGTTGTATDNHNDNGSCRDIAVLPPPRRRANSSSCHGCSDSLRRMMTLEDANNNHNNDNWSAATSAVSSNRSLIPDNPRMTDHCAYDFSSLESNGSPTNNNNDDSRHQQQSLSQMVWSDDVEQAYLDHFVRRDQQQRQGGGDDGASVSLVEYSLATTELDQPSNHPQQAMIHRFTSTRSSSQSSPIRQLRPTSSSQESVVGDMMMLDAPPGATTIPNVRPQTNNPITIRKPRSLLRRVLFPTKHAVPTGTADDEEKQSDNHHNHTNTMVEELDQEQPSTVFPEVVYIAQLPTHTELNCCPEGTRKASYRTKGGRRNWGLLMAIVAGTCVILCILIIGIVLLLQSTTSPTTTTTTSMTSAANTPPFVTYLSPAPSDQPLPWMHRKTHEPSMTMAVATTPSWPTMAPTEVATLAASSTIVPTTEDEYWWKMPLRTLGPTRMPPIDLPPELVFDATGEPTLLLLLPKTHPPTTTTAPTPNPTRRPTTNKPTRRPTTAKPTRRPTQALTATDQPTRRPTKTPTTAKPTRRPTKAPTTDQPTRRPTKTPTTDQPTRRPTTTSAPVVMPAPPLGMATACSAHPQCAKLAGDCCPTRDHVFLHCCGA